MGVIVEGDNGTSHAFLDTPQVRQEARNHFQCPTLPGAETENAGGAGSGGGGTVISGHFDARIFAVRSPFTSSAKYSPSSSNMELLYDVFTARRDGLLLHGTAFCI